MATPPYLPTTTPVGGQPTPGVDDAVCAVMIFLFALVAVFHMTSRVKQFERHRSRLSILLFAFSLARVVALVLRIVWASQLTNVNIAIASNVFTAAGVIIVFVVNMILARRVLADYATFGRHRSLDLALRFLLLSIVACLIMVVTATVYSFFTLDAAKRQTCREIQLFASTYLTVLAFIPVPVVALAFLFPRKLDDRGTRKRFHARSQFLTSTAVLLTIGAGFRAGTLFDARPLGQTMWFHHKAAFYCFNFGIELIVIYIFALSRFDRRFNLSKPPSSTDKETAVASETEGSHQRRGFFSRLNHDRDVFGGGDEK